jgi:hypothetical protein
MRRCRAEIKAVQPLLHDAQELLPYESFAYLPAHEQKLRATCREEWTYVRLRDRYDRAQDEARKAEDARAAALLAQAILESKRTARRTVRG